MSDWDSLSAVEIADGLKKIILGAEDDPPMGATDGSAWVRPSQFNRILVLGEEEQEPEDLPEGTIIARPGIVLQKLWLTDDPSDPDSQFAILEIEGDTSNTNTWPNRFECFFTSAFVGTDQGVRKRTFFLNEYGELRVAPGRHNTVPVRVFQRELPGHGRNMEIPLIEVMDNRVDRNRLAAIHSDGTIETVSEIDASNIGNKVVAISQSDYDLLDPPDPDVIYITTDD